MTVSFYYRTPGSLYSIERVFAAVRAGLPAHVKAEEFYCRYRRGPIGLLFNILAARQRQANVNHITGDVHYLALGLDPKKTVLTVHDCGTLRRLTGWRRELARLLWFEWPTRRVAAVTVISEATKRELLEWTSCSPARIHVIPNPLTSGYAPVLREFNGAKPRILQIGTRENKNLEQVARALRGLPCELLIVGRVSADQASLLQDLNIDWTAMEDVTDDEMLAVYGSSDVLTFCSTYEGFGLPVIEANAVGRPVVASDIEPIRGVAGDAACLVDPVDPESIRAGVKRVIEDAAYRSLLVEKGFENARRFEARNIARRHTELYERILRGTDGDCREGPQ